MFGNIVHNFQGMIEVVFMGTPVSGFHSLQRHQFGENQRQQSAAVQFYKAFGRYGGEQDLVQLVGDALFGDNMNAFLVA